VSQADELERLGLDPAETAALAGDEAERWLQALSAAAQPGSLSAAENERLIAMALEDPLAPPSEEELIESARLRDALAGGAPHESAALLAALRAPFGAEEAENAAIESALGRLVLAADAPKPPRRNVIYAAFGAGSLVLAAAAAMVLVFGAASREGAPTAAVADGVAAGGLVKPHSTAALFASHFDSNTTARVDLIESVRSRDLRDNRYAAWGVR